MSQAPRWSLALATSFVAMHCVAAAATQEQIGSWVLTCPGKTPGTESCMMRADKRFLDKGGITGDLEIQAAGKSLVPVVALRGLSTEMLMAASMAGKTEVSIQFPGGPREDLNCAVTSAGYICAPNDAAGQRLSARLATARTATVRASVSMPGVNPLPAQEKSLELSGTGEALNRLRAAGPSQVPSPVTALASQSPEGLMGMADKALKAAGYPNGAATIQSLLAKYMRK
jgi:hypothetical protein